MPIPPRLLWHIWLLSSSLIGALTACDPGPPVPPEARAAPPGFRAGTGDTEQWPNATWWQGFASPELTALINDARAHNLDLAAAAARIRQADAQLRIAGAPLLPSLAATGGGSWQHAGANTSSGGSRVRSGSVDLHSYNMGLSASYEVDLWGRLSSNREAVLANALASRFDRQTIMLTVVSNVASIWFTALALADRLRIAERNLADAEAILAVFQGRRDAGTAGELDVAQQQTFVATSRAVIPNLRNQQEQAVIGLGILTGRAPEAVRVTPGTLNTLALPPVAPGLPSDLLTRRPDIAQAESALTARHLNIQSARAAFFPSIQLTASTGYQAAALGTLVGPGGTLMSLALGLTAPIFDGGTLAGQLELTKGQYDEQLATYRKTVLQAFTDVDNALTAWRFTSEQTKLQESAVSQARRAATIARAQMAAGTVDIVTVLNVETTLLNSEDTLAQVKLARAQALLSLYKALGGGWRREEHPGLSPGTLPGGVALPMGENMR